MRSHPSCWNKTLAQLGFRRRSRRQIPKDFLKRRSLFESLEERQLLSADPLLDYSSDDIVVLASALTDETLSAQLQQEFYLIQSEVPAGELEGLSEEDLAAFQPIFAVDTEQTDSGPKAKVYLNPEYEGPIPNSLQTLQLELRQNGIVLQEYEILIDLAEVDFRERFLNDRIEVSRFGIPEMTREQVDEWIVPRTTINRYQSLQQFIGPLELGDQEFLSEVSAKRDAQLAKLETASTADLTVLAKRELFKQDVFLTAREREEFYDKLELHSRQIKQARDAAVTEAEKAEATEREKLFHDATLLLAKLLQQDLESEALTVAQSAKKLRDELVAISDPMDLLFAGLNVDHEFDRRRTSNGSEKALSFVETGRYKFSDQLEIDLGDQQAMIQVTRLGDLRLRRATYVAESPAVADGSIAAANPTTNGGTVTSLYVDGATGASQEALVRFSFDQFTGLENPTTIASAALQLSEITAGSGTAEVYVWNSLFAGSSGSPSEWNESNLTWNHVDGTLDLESKLSEFTQLADWTSGTSTEVDVTNQVQRALLFGDADGDGDFGASDIEAFHIAVTNLTCPL